MSSGGDTYERRSVLSIFDETARVTWHLPSSYARLVADFAEHTDPVSFGRELGKRGPVDPESRTFAVEKLRAGIPPVYRSFKNEEILDLHEEFWPRMLAMAGGPAAPAELRKVRKNAIRECWKSLMAGKPGEPWAASEIYKLLRDKADGKGLPTRPDAKEWEIFRCLNELCFGDGKVDTARGLLGATALQFFLGHPDVSSEDVCHWWVVAHDGDSPLPGDLVKRVRIGLREVASLKAREATRSRRLKNALRAAGSAIAVLLWPSRSSAKGLGGLVTKFAGVAAAMAAGLWLLFGWQSGPPFQPGEPASLKTSPRTALAEPGLVPEPGAASGLDRNPVPMAPSLPGAPLAADGSPQATATNPSEQRPWTEEHPLDQLATTPPAVAAQAVESPCAEGWREQRRDPSVIVCFKDRLNAPGREFKAYTDLDASPASVFRVITDFKHYPEFMPFVRESNVRRLGSTEVLSNQWLSLPIIYDREVVLKVTSRKDGATYESRWTSEPDDRPAWGSVSRLRGIEGGWLLDPIDRGRKTRGVYSLVTGSDGVEPEPHLNESYEIAIPRVLEGIKKRLADLKEAAEPEATPTPEPESGLPPEGVPAPRAPAVAGEPLGRAGGNNKPGPEWIQARKDNQLVIYYRDAPNAEARDLRATGEMNATPEVIFNAVTDFENYPKFMPYTKEARIVQRMSDSVVLGYFLLDPPLVSARDYCIQLTFTRGTDANGGVFKSEWTAKPSAVPSRDGVVRVQVNNGSWLMEPLDGGHRTRVTYSLFTDPVGRIPRWIANTMDTTAIPEVFKAVRKRATGKE